MIRDVIKEIVRGELGSMSSSTDARLGIVKSTKGDSADILVDGQIFTVRLSYPATVGQEVVVLPGDSGRFESAFPTRPAPDPVIFEQPPFFAASGGLLRFFVDETGLIAPTDTPTWRFQDQKSRKVYRQTLIDLADATSLALWFNLSPNGKKFSFSVTIDGQSKYVIRSYNLGAKLADNGVIDLPNEIYVLKATLLEDIVISGISLSTNKPQDTFVDDKLYFLQQTDFSSGSPPPVPPVDDNDPRWSPTKLDFGTALEGGSNPPDQGAVLTTGFSSSWSINTGASWLTAIPSSGTTPSHISTASITFSVNISGLSRGSHTTHVVASGTNSLGSFTATMWVSVTIRASTQTIFRFYNLRDASGNVASIEVPWNSGSGYRWLSPKILDAKNKILVVRNTFTGNVEVIDMTVGATPVFSVTGSGLTAQNRTKNFFIQSFTVTSPSVTTKFIRRDKDGNYVALALISPTQTFVAILLFTSTPVGYMMDAGVTVRVLTLSGTDLTGSTAVSDISPGEVDPTKVRELPSDGGPPFVTTFGFAS